MNQNGFDRRQVLGFCLVAAGTVLTFGRAVAAIAPGAGNPVAAVQEFGEALIRTMRAGAAVPFERRYALLAPAIDRTFDLDAILRTSVGPRWAAMSAEEHAALQAAFRRYTVANFVANFDSYSGQRIDVAPDVRAVSGGDQVVTSTISSGDGTTTSLAYVMRQTPEGWKAVDVLADGAISRVATQRSDFRGVLSRGGALALVESLQSKVAALSGGRLA